VLDAVILYNAKDKSAPAYWDKNLFGARVFLAEQEAWRCDGDDFAPEDAVPTIIWSKSRTVCRNEAAPDTDSAGDWYVTPTGKASPGLPNYRE
jgi:hypothetical protein